MKKLINFISKDVFLLATLKFVSKHPTASVLTTLTIINILLYVGLDFASGPSILNITNIFLSVAIVISALTNYDKDIFNGKYILQEIKEIEKNEKNNAE